MTVFKYANNQTCFQRVSDSYFSNSFLTTAAVFHVHLINVQRLGFRTWLGHNNSWLLIPGTSITLALVYLTASTEPFQFTNASEYLMVWRPAGFGIVPDLCAEMASQKVR